MAPRIRVDASPEGWERLASFVRERRDELELTQAQCVERSRQRISLPVWSILENARQKDGRMDRQSLRGASAALDLPEDYLERVATGKIDLTDATQRGDRIEDLERQLAEQGERLKRIEEAVARLLDDE